PSPISSPPKRAGSATDSSPLSTSFGHRSISRADSRSSTLTTTSATASWPSSLVKSTLLLQFPLSPTGRGVDRRQHRGAVGRAEDGFPGTRQQHVLAEGGYAHRGLDEEVERDAAGHVLRDGPFGDRIRRRGGQHRSAHHVV